MIYFSRAFQRAIARTPFHRVRDARSKNSFENVPPGLGFDEVEFGSLTKLLGRVDVRVRTKSISHKREQGRQDNSRVPTSDFSLEVKTKTY